MGLNWTYNGKDFTEDLVGNNYGFVYQITNLTNGRKYIGKKFFYSAKTKQVKGKKKRYKASSNWQTYYGSSDNLTKDVLQLGHENFNREILHLCNSKGEMSYFEAKEQFDREVLLSDEYYNGIINCKIHRTHVRSLKDVAKGVQGSQ